MASFDVSIIIKAKDEASKVLEGFSGNMEKHSRSIKLAGLAIAGVAVGVGGASLKLAGDFDAAMREVNSLINLSEEEYRSMSDAVLTTAKDVGKSPEELAKGLYQVISAGVPAAEAIDFLTIAAKAGIGGVSDTKTAVDGLTTAMNAFKMPMEDAGEAADLMFQAVKLGKTTFPELASSLSVVAPIAAALGLEFYEVTAATATLTKQGVPTATAMTQIRAMLVALASPTKEMSTLFEKMGFESGQAALEAMGFQGTMNALNTVTDRNQTILSEAFGRVEGFSGMLSLTGDNAAMAADDLDAMSVASDGLGASAEAYNEINKGTNRQLEILKTKVEDAAIKIGEALMPALLVLVDVLSPIITRIGDWIEANPEWTKNILIATGAIGALVLGLGFLPGVLRGASLAWGIFMGLINASLGPIGLIVMFIAGLAFLLKKYGETSATQIAELDTQLAAGAISEREWGQQMQDILVPVLPGYAAGGVVGGPLGAPTPIIAHGGETVVPAGRSLGGPGITNNLTLQVGLLLGDRNDAERLIDMVQEGLRARQRYAFGEGSY